MTWAVALTPQAGQMLENIRDRRIQRALRDRMRALAHEPEKQGKPLTDELRGTRSVRAVGQRYRILYRLKRQRVVVLVVAVGLRKQGSKDDIYREAKKLLRLRLLDPDEDEE